MHCDNKIKMWLLFFMFLLLAASIVNADIDPLVEEKLKEQGEVSVIVVLKDEPIASEAKVSSLESKENGLENKKEMIKEQQEKVLSKLSLQDSRKFIVFSGKKADFK